MANRNDFRRDSRKDRKKNDIGDRLVTINRIAEVVKGGCRMRFAAVVIVGDRKGHVGFGTGKVQEVPEVTHKVVKAGKRRMIKVSTVGTTIPHEVMGHYGSGNIILKPARADSGVAVGGTVRIIMDLAGISDVTPKSSGSNIPINVIHATMGGLSKLKTREDALKLHESAKSLED